ncbi:MAG: CRISPR-associated endoribonuclease Cas2 [Patescibacteria group bacterium]|nr:MAG: CRISPR-associated endoribonuclease Cas2 [Chitinophagales bacterium]GIW60987.1 MAG: CRISPR-associated endoribonuclease Cas2 [Patescibacteria group bacterium]GIW70433.1 MAG: CRISPR-associated endoribonuclease Cas2 [Patescibacteria group bacterium]
MVKNHFSRLSAYRVMWLFVIFDLPTETKADRKAYAEFRKKLQRQGFTMMQYSVYIRHCAGSEAAETYIKKVKSFIPAKGHVSIVQITDRQFGNIVNFWGSQPAPLPKAPKQLEFF